MRERIKPIGRKDRVFAIDVAEACYLKWGGVNFAEDLSHYLLNGVVIVRPDLFGIAQVIDLAPEGTTPPEPAWFVRMAVGDLRELVAELPFYLPKICFCRRNDDGQVMKKYSLDRFAKAVGNRRKT
jgi:hypothetical protein